MSPRKIRRGPRDRCGPREAAGTAALRLLSRRPRTVLELRHALAEGGHDTGEIDAALDALLDEGKLDDGELALHYILVRTDRLGHGRDRLLRELEARGVDEDVAGKAWQSAVDEYGVDPARLLARQAQRQLNRCGGRLGPAAYRRVYNALLRAGFGAYDVRKELEPYRAFDDDAGESGIDEADHDLR